MLKVNLSPFDFRKGENLTTHHTCSYHMCRETHFNVRLDMNCLLIEKRTDLQMESLTPILHPAIEINYNN